MSNVGEFEFAASLWRYPGEQGWHFVALPVDVSAEIDDLTIGLRHGFGSVKVVVRIGGSEWRTSLFPDSTRGTFVLPVKKPVRTAEGLEADDDVVVHLGLADL